MTERSRFHKKKKKMRTTILLFKNHHECGKVKRHFRAVSESRYMKDISRDFL